MRRLSRQPWLCCSQLLYDREHRKTGISFCRDSAAFLGGSAFCPSQALKRGRELMSSWVPRILPLFEEPEDELFFFFCLDCEEPLPLLEDDLLLSFFSNLLPEELVAEVSRAISALCSQ